MTATYSPADVAWLRELVRRIGEGLPRDARTMMVALRDQLPAGFLPTQLDYRLVNNDGPTLEGLLELGDPERYAEDVERVILWMKARLIHAPLTDGISSQEVAEGLGLPIERTELALRLMSSLGHFWGSATGSPNGYSAINVNRDEVVAEYLAFTTVSAALAKRRSVVEAVERFHGRRTTQPAENAKVVRNRAFIVMSMNKADASLDDVHDTIRAVCGEFDIEAVRVDDIEHQDRITDLILENIASAEFIIADLSGERPNVYYEIGYAHAIGKHPILVRKVGTPLHFDLVVHNAPEYRNNAELKVILRRRLENMLGRLGSKPSTE